MEDGRGGEWEGDGIGGRTGTLSGGKFGGVRIEKGWGMEKCGECEGGELRGIRRCGKW